MPSTRQQRRPQARWKPVLGVKKEAWVAGIFQPAAFAAAGTLPLATTPVMRMAPAHARQGGLFATCYINYNEPGPGQDLVKLLRTQRHSLVTLAEKEACCGMPKLELGDLDAVEKLKDINIPVWPSWLTPATPFSPLVPSCTLMFKSELPLMFPDDAGRAGGLCRMPCTILSNT
jgi:glycerol-3-phosphate dehydrogenase subunit C